MRDIITLVEGLFLEGSEPFPKTASADAIARLVQDVHYAPEDLDDGDLGERIARFHTYVLQALPVSSIASGEWSPNGDAWDDAVEAFAERLKAGETPPPIIYDAVDRSIIDGTHRVAAAKLAGTKTIMAYVGLVENMSDEEPETWTDWHELPVGTILYHGTSEDFDPTEISGPAWFSTEIKVAQKFSRGGPIFVYRVEAPITLALIEDGRAFDRFKEIYNIESYSAEDMAEGMRYTDLDGWIIPNNYNPGDDILLVGMSDIDYIKTL
jgi:hypothetical protein